MVKIWEQAVVAMLKLMLNVGTGVNYSFATKMNIHEASSGYSQP